jgi:hypothetical protein
VSHPCEDPERGIERTSLHTKRSRSQFKSVSNNTTQLRFLPLCENDFEARYDHVSVASGKVWAQERLLSADSDPREYITNKYQLCDCEQMKIR